MKTSVLRYRVQYRKMKLWHLELTIIQAEEVCR